MNFNKANNLTGWLVCFIACAIYITTMERTGSLWDCGEFISSAYKLQIPHPPGAPLFVLLGRLFVIIFGDSPAYAALAVNCMSALASGFTILFLFWTITQFARKIVQPSSSQPDVQQTFSILSAGAVGALAYAFSDSFWFSAVEGEVYALSSLFTAIVFWAILKWDQEIVLENKPANKRFSRADRWIVFIFFMMGLSIGVHLLNLLTIPAIVMVYYFRRYKPTTKGTIAALIAGCLITGFVQKFIIQYTIKGAGWFDIYFVNDLGMPFFTGFTTFFILLAALITYSIQYARKKKNYYLHLGLWCTAFMLLGYSTYLTTIIRSNADPAVDMFNVDNPVSLSGYLGREQYGDWPLLYGPDFTERAPVVDNGPLYVKGSKKYEIAGTLVKQEWSNTATAHFFPRMWDNGNDRQQLTCYRQFAGLEEGESPTMPDNMRYFVNYQAGWMYWRYFMWNFAGRQNDLQGFGNARDSNWISGIPLVDKAMRGSQNKLPDSIHMNNKANNRLFMLPFLLGIIGIVFNFRRSRQDFLVNLLLFLCTGMAIVIYLNQAGFQPRERDYAYVGSFYAFAIWIGLGVVWVNEQFKKIVRAGAANYLSLALCLVAVPAIMCWQEWDDHDRSQKTLARDMARNYLESCPPNAILFSYEDNDTYPLWYAQEVEGIRPDVRVVVNTLLGSDWYMNQLRYKINQSAPFDLLFTPEQVSGNKRGVVYYSGLPGFDQSKYYDLHDVLKNVTASDDPMYTAQAENGETVNLFPVKKFSVPVDLSIVRSNGTLNAGEQAVSELHLDLPGTSNHLFKNDLAVLSIIATNKWQRPVCFTSDQQLNELGLDKYVRLEGLSYRLVPVENSHVNIETAYHNIMQKFSYGYKGDKAVYFDEENRRRLNIIRLAHARVALSLVQAGKKKEARQVLERMDQALKEKDFPYGMTCNRGNQHNGISTQFLQACYESEDLRLAKKVSDSLQRDLDQQMSYYKSLGEESVNSDQLAINAYQLLQGKGGELSPHQLPFASDILSCYQIQKQVEEWKKQF